MQVRILTTSLKNVSAQLMILQASQAGALAMKHTQADTNAQAAASSALSLQSLKCKMQS